MLHNISVLTHRFSSSKYVSSLIIFPFCLHTWHCRISDHYIVVLYTLVMLTPWSWALLKRPQVGKLLKNFATFYRTRRFITVFTIALHWSLSCARSIQSIPPYSVFLRSILILSSHIYLLVILTFKNGGVIETIRVLINELTTCFSPDRPSSDSWGIEKCLWSTYKLLLQC
jgi:hypothetical protein